MQDLPIGIVDLVVLGLLFLSGLLAYFRGFVREVTSVVVWVGAIAATAFGYSHAVPWVARVFDVEPFTTIVAAVATFAVSLIALSIVSRMLSSGVRESAAGPLDKALGFVFGLARGALILCIAYLGMAKLMDNELPADVAAAKTLPAVQIASAWLISISPASIREAFDDVALDVEGAAERARRMQDAYEMLTSPTPGVAETNAAGTNAAGAQDAAPAGPAYPADERRQLDSLIKQAE